MEKSKDNLMQDKIQKIIPGHAINWQSAYLNVYL